MSDSAQGPDWWMGTDGKWYPPVAPSSPEGKAAGTVPERDKSSKRFWLIGAGLLAIVIVGSIAVLLIAGGGSSPKHDLTGTFTLEEGTLSATPGKPCTAKSSGYSDISQGTTVTVSDGNWKTWRRTTRSNCDFYNVVLRVSAGRALSAKGRFLQSRSRTSRRAHAYVPRNARQQLAGRAQARMIH
jgi:hypothetical protein